MTTHKIALILAGGASLGSYTAGVLTELLYALETLNARSNDQRFEIDVITGSSAGGLTGVLLTRIMLYDLHGRRRDLFHVWVREIDIKQLLDKGNIPPNALLSKRVIRRIAQQYVLNGVHQTATNPASFAPDDLRLSLTLSNMHGLDYAIPYDTPEGGSFVSTFYADMARFQLKPAALPNYHTWQTIVNAGIASGNFPIAFQPQSLPHDVSSALKEYQESPQASAAISRLLLDNMAFLDGGIFNNEPLREAIKRAGDLDGERSEHTRIFILIDPDVNRSAHNPSISADDPIEEHVKQLLTMIRGESMARDWMNVRRTNNELDWRNDMLTILIDMVRACPEEQGNELVKRLDALIASIMQVKRDTFPGRYPPEYEEHVLQRLSERPEYRETYEALLTHGGTSATLHRVMLDRLTFALNAIAGLQNKSTIQKLALIGSKPEETAGDQILSFGGFFNEAWREHDFRRGRIKAHEVLPDILAVAPYGREQDVDDYEIPDAWKHFPTANFEDTDRGTREQLCDILLQRSNEVLKRANVPWWIRWPAKQFYIRGQLRAFLKL
ncbi:MAG: hypothetical protein HC837_19170 [Chloroflexaceae bacterium]|nr:hypothetical protein [Chloroflexaceae bacterium]